MLVYTRICVACMRVRHGCEEVRQGVSESGRACFGRLFGEDEIGTDSGHQQPPSSSQP